MHSMLIAVVVAYLLGSIPFGYILMLVFRKEDVRASGSGNIGATNVARTGGKGLGIATLLLDLGKAIAAVALAQHVIAPGNYDVACAAAIAVICGHIFPVWLGFRGGKGVASGLGVFIALSPPTAACIFAVFVGIFLLTRYVSLGSIIATATVPLFGLHFQHYRSPLMLAAYFLIPALLILKHHQNIRRLLNGTESKFTSSKGDA